MTPDRLIPLVARALGRPGNKHELADWAAVLHATTDDDADAGLLLHRSNSPHPPTPSDVRKAAVAIANDRAQRAVATRRRQELETGIALEGDHAGQPLVPMPPEIREQLVELEQRHQVPAAGAVDDETRMAQARAELAGRRPAPIPEDVDA